MHESAQKKNQKDMFIYEQFNVKCFTLNPLSALHNVPARIVNAFIKALNECNKLPEFVIVIPDWNLPKFVNFFGDEAKLVLYEVMSWIVTSFNHAIQSKKDGLSHRKPGSVMLIPTPFGSKWSTGMHISITS